MYECANIVFFLKWNLPCKKNVFQHEENILRKYMKTVLEKAFPETLFCHFRCQHLRLLAHDQRCGIVEELLCGLLLTDVVGDRRFKLLVGDMVTVEEVLVILPCQLLLSDAVWRTHLQCALNQVAVGQDVDQRDAVDQVVGLLHHLFLAVAAGEQNQCNKGN